MSRNYTHNLSQFGVTVTLQIDSSSWSLGFNINSQQLETCEVRTNDALDLINATFGLRLKVGCRDAERMLQRMLWSFFGALQDISLWYIMSLIYDIFTVWYIMIHYDTLWYMIPYTLTFNIDELCRIGSGSALSIDKAEGPEDPERQVELGRFHAMAGWAGSPCWSLPSVTESRPWSLGGTSCRFLHVQALFRDLQFLKAFQHFMRPPRALQHKSCAAFQSFALSFAKLSSFLAGTPLTSALSMYYFFGATGLTFLSPLATGQMEPSRCRFSGMGAFKVDIFLMIGSLPRWGQTRLRGYTRDVNHYIYIYT